MLLSESEEIKGDLPSIVEKTEQHVQSLKNSVDESACPQDGHLLL